MSRFTVNENIIVATKDLHIDCYDRENHQTINLTSNNDSEDKIIDVVISFDNKYLAIITSTSKQLRIYNLPTLKEERAIVLPRSASKIRFTVNNTQILVADKTGDSLIYNISTEDSGTKLLGHLSLLLNVLQTSDGKYIITSDRDEKIRVSCYPKTYIIQSYCLGHKEFVISLELLPHNEKYLVSSSGDGTVKCWDYENGTLCYTIDTYTDVYDEKIKEEFIKLMDEEGIEVDRLPIVCFAILKLNDSRSVIALSVYLVKKVFIYTIDSGNEQFSHKLVHTLNLSDLPTAIKMHASILFIYIEDKCEVLEYKIISDQNNLSFDFVQKITMFKDVDFTTSNNQNSIKMLYKRKFDNVQEYQERKKQRLGIA